MAYRTPSHISTLNAAPCPSCFLHPSVSMSVSYLPVSLDRHVFIRLMRLKGLRTALTDTASEVKTMSGGLSHND